MDNPFTRPLLLDGATGTNLMAAGMPQGACTEQWIVEHPQPLRQLQQAYAAAGCGMVTAPTFGANRLRLGDYGLADRVEEMNLRLVALSREAVGPDVRVAGDMAPTGGFVEPFGDMTFDELVDVYREQARALKKAGADYIAAETMTGLTEARAALLAAKETGLPVTVSLTVDEKGRLLSGGDPTACLLVLRSMGADAVGLNCSTGPQIIFDCLRAAAPFVAGPLLAKPNAGLPDPARPGMYDIGPEAFAAFARPFLETGVELLGGCCGTTPAHMAALHREIARLPFARRPAPQTDARRFLTADERHVWKIDPETIGFSHKLDCGPDLGDDLIRLSEEEFVAVRVRIRSEEDARQFGLNAYLCALPVVLLGQDAAALETALRLYNGRAMVDSKSELPLPALRALADRYGAEII